MGNYSRKLDKDFQIQIPTTPTYPVPNLKLAEIGPFFLTESQEQETSHHLRKWEKLLFSYNSPSILTSPKFRRNFINLTKEGLPALFRWEAWKVITQLHNRVDENIYKGLPPPDILTQQSIHKDLDRTFPQHPYFCKEKFGFSGQNSLEAVLSKLASRFPSLKYCQSLNFVAGFVLLANGGNDIEAFFLLETILQNYNLHGFYTEDMAYIQKSVWVFQRLFEKEFPKLASHFEASGIYPEMWVLQWFMTLFTTLLKPSLLLKVWDFFLIDKLPFLYRISLAIIGTFQRTLLEIDEQEITKFLKDLGGNITDEKSLIKSSKKFNVHEGVIKKLEQRYETLILIDKAQSQEESRTGSCSDISTDGANFMLARHQILREISAVHFSK